MAEQAINTVYLLGEQPDALCSDIIRTFTRKVFANETLTVEGEERSPDRSQAESVPGSPIQETSDGSLSASPMADIANAFQFSQLIFIVGHIAFKHIVYLELVERELKRRKDALVKGIHSISVCCMTPHLSSRRVGFREGADKRPEQIN